MTSPTANEPNEQLLAAQQLLAGAFFAVLSTHSREHPGYPFGSVSPYALDHNGYPILLFSAEAQVVMVGMDALGIDLRQLDRLTRIALRHRIANADEAREALVELTQRSLD